MLIKLKQIEQGEELKASTEELKVSVKNLETSTGELKATTENLKTSVRSLETRTGDLETSTNSLKTSVEGLETSVEGLEASVEDLEKSIAERKDGKDGTNGKDGVNGKDGASAFEIANKVRKEAGQSPFNSEAEFIASLKGKDGSGADISFFKSDEADILTVTGQDPEGISDAEATSSAAAVKLYKSLLRQIKNIKPPTVVNRINKTLKVSAWNDSNMQTITDTCIKSNSVVLMALPLGTSESITTAFVDADIIASEQKDGSITLKYTGIKPIQDFVVDFCIL